MRPRGFTLIELLVVVSIVALLMALLFPVFSSARKNARAARCGANIRQLLLNLHDYDAQNQSFPHGFHITGTPPPDGYAGNATVDPMGWWWFNFADMVGHRSLREMAILQCPAKRLNNPMLETSLLAGNYGANLGVCRSKGKPVDVQDADRPLSLSQVRHPALTLLLLDSGYAVIGWWHVATGSPVKLSNSIQDTAYVPGLSINKEKLLWPGQRDDAIGGRHPNKTVNVGFVDGHVNRLDANDLLVEETQERQWDSRPLWQPD